MAITASKPAINIREKLSELDQPQGIKGTEVLRADTADEARNAIGARGRKNLIINGGFDVWQRGVSGTLGNGTYNTADRWRGNLYSNGTISLDKRTDATGQDFTTYARFNQSVAGTVNNRQGLIHYIEGDYAVGKTITISFKARASKTITNCVVRGAISVQTFNVTTSWQTFSFTGTGLANGSNVALMIDGGYENDTWSIDLAQVQLEVGDQATEFEHRSYGEELALCQRYFFKTGPQSITSSTMTGIQVSVSAGEDPQYTHFFSPQMAGTPDITLVRYTSTATAGQWHGAAFSNGSSSNARSFGVSSQRVIIDNTDVGASSTGFAEIAFYADAEL